MGLCIIKVVLVGLAIMCCDSATWKRSVEDEPIAVQEIRMDPSELKPDEIPLVVKRESYPDAPAGNPVESLDNPDESVDNPDAPIDNIIESVDSPDVSVVNPVAPGDNLVESVDNPDELVDRPDALVVNPGAPADNSVESFDNSDESFDNADESAVNPDEPAESMETANTMVFRPLFAYRSQAVERRSVGYRQHRRAEGTSSGSRSNYFRNPPPYLVYDRNSGAYYPYYNNVRRS